MAASLTLSRMHFAFGVQVQSMLSRCTTTCYLWGSGIMSHRSRAYRVVDVYHRYLYIRAACGGSWTGRMDAVAAVADPWNFERASPCAQKPLPSSGLLSIFRSADGVSHSYYSRVLRDLSAS